MRHPGARTSGAQQASAAGPRPAARQLSVPAACGHTRYTKGCDICALTGIYQDHMNRVGITPAERSAVIQLYMAGDKAAMFKLWKAWRQDDGP